MPVASHHTSHDFPHGRQIDPDDKARHTRSQRRLGQSLVSFSHHFLMPITSNYQISKIILSTSYSLCTPNPGTNEACNRGCLQSLGITWASFPVIRLCYLLLILKFRIQIARIVRRPATSTRQSRQRQSPALPRTEMLRGMIRKLLMPSTYVFTLTLRFLNIIFRVQPRHRHPDGARIADRRHQFLTPHRLRMPFTHSPLSLTMEQLLDALLKIV